MPVSLKSSGPCQRIRLSSAARKRALAERTVIAPVVGFHRSSCPRGGFVARISSSEVAPTTVRSSGRLPTNCLSPGPGCWPTGIRTRSTTSDFSRLGMSQKDAAGRRLPGGDDPGPVDERHAGVGSRRIVWVVVGVPAEHLERAAGRGGDPPPGKLNNAVVRSSVAPGPASRPTGLRWTVLASTSISRMRPASVMAASLVRVGRVENRRSPSRAASSDRSSGWRTDACPRSHRSSWSSSMPSTRRSGVSPSCSRSGVIWKRRKRSASTISSRSADTFGSRMRRRSSVRSKTCSRAAASSPTWSSGCRAADVSPSARARMVRSAVTAGRVDGHRRPPRPLDGRGGCGSRGRTSRP